MATRKHLFHYRAKAKKRDAARRVKKLRAKAEKRRKVRQWKAQRRLALLAESAALGRQ